VFSGRFAFRDWDVLVEGAPVPIEHIERSERERYGETLQHEEAHHRVARQSMLNQWIVGDRFWARVAFWRGNEATVSRHYTVRTVYFAMSYQLHEELVDCLTREKRTDLTNEEKQQVLRMDEAVQSVLSTVGIARLGHHGLRKWLGKIATREFAVVLTERGHGGARLREGASRSGFGGVFNAAFQPSPTDPWYVRAVKATHRLVNIERIARLVGRGLDAAHLRRWAEIKLRAEWHALAWVGQSGSPLTVQSNDAIQEESSLLRHPNTRADYFLQYLRAILPFAVRFGRSPSRAEIADAYDLADALLRLVANDLPLDVLSPPQLSVFDAASGFFYYHGN